MRIIRATDQEFIPASHEDSKNPGVWKRVLATKNELHEGRVQMINWARLPVGSSFRAHYHEDMQETFIIISGTVEMAVGDDREQLGPGDAIMIEPQEVHMMRNTCGDEVEYIVMGISEDKGGQTVVVEGQ